MKLFWIEGVITTKTGSGRKAAPGVRPFSQSFWANTAQEAIQMAYEATAGARWTEGPSVRDQSEEQRMRALGAPELFASSPKTNRKKSAKK